MNRRIERYFFYVLGCIATMMLLLRRTLVRSVRYSAKVVRSFIALFKTSPPTPLQRERGFLLTPDFANTQNPAYKQLQFFRSIEKRGLCVGGPSPFGEGSGVRSNMRKAFVYLCIFLFSWFNLQAQRTPISLNSSWLTIADDTNQNAYNNFENISFNDKQWKKVDVPHNWDAYEGYRRKLHGNRHGYAWYRKTFTVKQQPTNKRIFLFFEGVGSYATVWLNGKQVGYHAGGRTTFTIDITNTVKFNQQNLLAVRADHPANIKDLPWVCGGCSDERGFSEGSQPMGIFRPVQLIITNDVRIEPFGLHVWNDTTVNEKSASLFYRTEVKNYSNNTKQMLLKTLLFDAKGKLVNTELQAFKIESQTTEKIYQEPHSILKPKLWSLENAYLYTVVSELYENNKLIDRIKTPYGIRTISWPIGKPKSSNQFLLNGKPVFINGIAEYEHLLGGSHAFTKEQILSRVMQMKAAGFNAFRDAHHPHNLLYQHYWDSLGILSWTQMGAHIWYDTPAFRENFKTLLKEWVKERRNSPSIVLWGLQNESKLPEDFAKECTAIIRELDPTTSTQRLVTTCNGGSGTDWDVPQNWTGTYGGNPATYSEDVKRQILIGEYGAWRTLDLHTEGGFVQNGPYSEDRFCQLMEQKIRLAEMAKDSTAGHFMWLFTSHDNPGRVQGGEGFRELDRIGPVNYKGLFTPWEEPTDAYYMYRSNYAPKDKEAMVYIVSHTWPNRWTKPGKKDGIVVYSNCDEVELFNDWNRLSLGRKKRGGIGTHFTWNGVNVNYNVLYAVGYVNGKEVAKDYIVLNNLPQAPNFHKFYEGSKSSSVGGVRGLTAPQPNYNYLYRINCGGPYYKDENGNTWLADRTSENHQPPTRNQKPETNTWGSSSWTSDFPGMPPYFASQRTTNDPIAATKDWKLFQSFRYGKEKLRYDFPVPDDEYLVELYFIEPWLGTGGGMDATGWRLFDVAINDKVVLKNVDIWKEVGHDVALKKTVKVKVTGGMLTIHFPTVAAGQAIISAIAIATTNKNAKAAPSPEPLLRLEYGVTNNKNELQDWLSVGNKFVVGSRPNEDVSFNYLPSELTGAQWVNLIENKTILSLMTNDEADVYVAVDTALHPTWLKNYSQLKEFIQLSNEKIYRVYKKREFAGSRFETVAIQAAFIMVQPASNIEPAYDLKPTTSYKAFAANLTGKGLRKGQVDGKERAIFETASADNVLEWNFTVGVADIYSLTISYNNPSQQIMKGKLQLLSADGVVMKEEAVEFTPTQVGKSNYITTNTGSMINAGHYKIKLSAGEAVGLSVNSLDVQ